MTEALPISCSLSAGDLKQRLAEIAAIGEESLIEHGTDKGVHILRLRADPGTRKRLEEIVAAEEECCSFLDLILEERGDELTLLVTARQNGQVVADELAAAFASQRRPSAGTL